MPTFVAYVPTGDGLYYKADLGEFTRVEKAADAYFADNPLETGEVEFVNEAHVKPFKTVRSVEPAGGEKPKRRKRAAKPATPEPEQTGDGDPARNEGVDDEALAKSPFSAGDGEDGPDDDEGATQPIKGFGTRE